MKIEEIDKNLKVPTEFDLPDLKWLTPLDEPLSLHGIHSYTKEDGYLRLPLDVATATGVVTAELAHHTAGGRIRFRTNSTKIAVKVYCPYTEIMPHITAIGQRGLDVYVHENGVASYDASIFPAFKEEENGLFSYEGLIYSDGKMKTFSINMPLYGEVREIYIGFLPDSDIEKAEDYTISTPVLYYGSSITQGGCASRPGNAYQGFISRRFDCDFINLGFSGNARGEQVMAKYLATLHPSIFVLDYDHNAPNPEHLWKTHEPFFKTFRASNPDTPVIMVTRPEYGSSPNRLALLDAVYTTYKNALAAGDKNVYFIDGSTLFEGDFYDSCTVDGCHPNDLGFYRMAQVIGDVMAPLIKKLK